MRRRYDSSSDQDDLRRKLIGLGEKSLRKNYYPQLRDRLAELERFRALLDQSTDAVLLVDISSLSVVDSNLAAGRLLERPDGDLISTNILEHIDCTQAPGLAELIHASPRNPKRQLAGTCQLRDRGGRLHPVEFTATSVTFDHRPYLVFVGRDISKRLSAEKALREREAQLASLANNLPNAVMYQLAITPDGQRKYLYVSENLERLNEIPAPALLADAALLHRQIAPPQLAELLERERQSQGDMSAFRFEAQFQLPSGRVRYFDIAATPHPGGEGQVVWDGVQVDITERKEAELARAQLEAQLRQSHKMEAIGTLAGGIAHDFNNLLGAIIGYTELATLYAQKDQSHQRELGSILKAAERAKALVRQILTFSRKSDIELRPLDTNQLLADAVRILERTIPKMVTIRLDLGVGLEPVLGDAVQLEQIVMNLAGNASDAMPDGGELVIATRQVHLDAAFADTHPGVKPGNHVQLTVSDSGSGMREDVVAKIFDPFFTTKDQGKGTGLGLSIVYGIVREHGGHISCQSETGMGTTFTVYLPSCLPPPNQVEPTPTSLLPPDTVGGNETILLVDDEPSLRDLGAQMLRQSGYGVSTVASGEEALAAMEGPGPLPDLVILDLGMPGMGGYRCLQELLARYPELKVMIATGYSAEGKVGDLLRQGARDYLLKPYKLSELLRTVRAVLDG